MQADGQVLVQPGDTIDVMIDRTGPEPEGYVLLSHDKATRIRSWDNLEKAHREGLLVSGRVVGRVKGGLSVDVGVKAFMPSSQVDVRPVPQPGGSDRSGHSGQDREGEPAARQRGGVAQAGMEDEVRCGSALRWRDCTKAR